MFGSCLQRTLLLAAATLSVDSFALRAQSSVRVERGRFFELPASASDLLVERFGQASVTLSGSPPIEGELRVLHDGRVYPDGVVDPTSEAGAFRPADGTVIEISLTDGCGPIEEIAVLSVGAPDASSQRFTLEGRCELGDFETLAVVDASAAGEEALRTVWAPDPDLDTPEYGVLRITFHVAPGASSPLYREIDVDSTTGPMCPASNARCDADELVVSPVDEGPGVYTVRATDVEDRDDDDVVYRFRLVRQLENGTSETRFVTDWQLSPEHTFRLSGLLDADSPPGPDVADESSGEWEFLIDVDDIPVCGPENALTSCPGTLIVVDPVDLRSLSGALTTSGDLVSRFSEALDHSELRDASGAVLDANLTRAIHDDTPFGSGAIEDEDPGSAFVPAEGDEVRFVLDTERSPDGYRVDEMRFLTASIAARTSQYFEVRVSTVDDPSRFGLLYSALLVGPPSGELLTSLRRRDPDGSERAQPAVRRVAEIRVRLFTAPGEAGASVWREIDVLGAPDGSLVTVDRFRRGDSNDDGSVDLSDAVFVFGFLFNGGQELACQDAGDTNDDGRLDLSDGVYELNFLFQGGSPPLPPFPGCGVDSSADALPDCGASRCA